MRLIFCLVLCISFFNDSSVRAQESARLPDSAMNAKKDILYKITPAGDSLLLDMFTGVAAKAEKKPVLIVIHGGAWAIGDRGVEAYAFIRKLRDQLVQKNMAVISIQYTLVTKDRHFPAPIADCQDAIRWVYANADKYGLDTTRIGLWGASAGGHLSLLAANSHEQSFAGDKMLAGQTATVRYVIDNFGPTDLTAMLQLKASKFKVWLAKLFIPKALTLRNNLITGIFDLDLKKDKDSILVLAKMYSPTNYLSSASVPVLILHGTKDKLVPYKQSRRLHKSLDELKVENKLVRVKKGNHGFTNISGEQTDGLVKEIVGFIEARNVRD